MDLMKNIEEYTEQDLVIMRKLEKKLKEAQMQIDGDSSVQKALKLYENTVSYLKSHDIPFWEALTEPAYKDYQNAVHLLRKPSRLLDKELEERFIRENPNVAKISVDELAKYLNEGCKHSRFPHEFQFNCLLTHYPRVYAHIRQNAEDQRQREALAEKKARQAEADMLKRLGL